ncbi:MAG: prkC 34 [Gemmataceae bacterium]|nr:prkC 34 [Gemmataceae bacterium]
MPDAPEKPDPGLADQPPADLTGRVLGEFQILRRLGAGGMGQVYLARQLSLKRQVALKLLLNDLANNPTAMKRFQAEAEAVARLNHPNIVQVYGAGESGGLRYMALEYVDGRNLREHLARKGPPDLPIALSIMRQVATALQKAHEQGLVHRDIKPENILVTRKVEVKVTDFGLSRFFAGAEAVNLTQSGVTLGTPLYLSPEQAQGRTVDHRSDIYSFGVTCYHLLSGEPPFRGSTAVEVALKHLTDQPRPLAALRPDLPPDLSGMVHKMMAKDPNDRYQSAREMMRDLAKVKDGLGLGLTPAGGPGGSGPAAAGLATVSGLTLSGSNPGVPGAAPTLTLTSSAGMPAAGPVRWGRWAAAGLACVLGAVGGAAAYVRRHPAAEAQAAPPPAQSAPGLPEVRPPQKLTTPRERELLKILEDRHTAGDRWIAASVELGLLYLREGRPDEAQARFESMEKEQLIPPRTTEEAHFAGRLGRAVVMAYRDNDPHHPQAAHESIELFTKAFAGPLPKKDKGDRVDTVRWFLFRHPDLAQAVSEALNRDAINTGQAKLSQPLEALRSPRGLTKKE